MKKIENNTKDINPNIILVGHSNQQPKTKLPYVFNKTIKIAQISSNFAPCAKSV